MIFESPDGGKTVTVRVPHSLEKQNITLDPNDLEEMEMTKLWFSWREILEAGKNNPALNDALDRVRVIYELSRSEN
jgi:hypothetical protein